MVLKMELQSYWKIFFFHKKKEITFTDFAQEFITILLNSVVFKLEEIEIGLHAQHGKM